MMGLDGAAIPSRDVKSKECRRRKRLHVISWQGSWSLHGDPEEANSMVGVISVAGDRAREWEWRMGAGGRLWAGRVVGADRWQRVFWCADVAGREGMGLGG